MKKKLFEISIIGFALFMAACMKQEQLRSVAGTNKGGNVAETEDNTVYNGTSGLRNNLALLNSMLLTTGVTPPNSGVSLPADINNYFKANFQSLPADGASGNVSPSETFAATILAARIATETVKSFGSASAGTQSSRDLFTGLNNNATFNEAQAVELAKRMSLRVNRREANADEIAAAKAAFAEVAKNVTGNGLGTQAAIVIITGYLSSLSGKSAN